MKQLVFYILCAAFFIACDRNPNNEVFILEKDQKLIIIDGVACGSIVFHSNIGKDFDSALDSLIKLRESLIFANTWVEEYYIEKEILTIDFNQDDRVFYSIGFKDRIKELYIFSINDVIDNRGNYYNILWCED